MRVTPLDVRENTQRSPDARQMEILAPFVRNGYPPFGGVHATLCVGARGTTSTVAVGEVTAEELTAGGWAGRLQLGNPRNPPRSLPSFLPPATKKIVNRTASFYQVNRLQECLPCNGI
jgi:hypothetical protein